MSYARYGALLPLPLSMSAFGIASFPIVGDLGFSNSWTYDDWSGKSGWMDHVRYWGLANPRLIDSNILATASTKYAALKDSSDSGNTQADSILADFTARITAIAKQADVNTSNFSSAGNASDDTHRARAAIFENLNSTIGQLANVVVPAPIDPEAEAAAKAAADAEEAARHEKDVAIAKATADALAAQQAAQMAAAQGTADAARIAARAAAQASQSKIAAQHAADKHRATVENLTALKPVLVTAAVVIPVLIVVALMLLRKPKAKMAGLRRHPRRRRN